MKLSHAFMATLVALGLGGCSFELPVPEPVPPSPVDLSHYEEFDGGLGKRWYDRNNQLEWIEHYVKDSQGHIIQNTHNNAFDVTEYIDVMRWQPFQIGGAEQWRNTRSARYLSPVSPATLRGSWAKGYGADGNEVLWAEYDNAGALKQYKVTWWDGRSPPHRLQESWFNASHVATGHARYNFQDPARDWWNPDEWMSVGGARAFGSLRAVTLDGSKRLVAEYDYYHDNEGGNDYWTRNTHDYIPSTNAEFYRTWSSAQGSPPANPLLSGTPAAALLPPLASPATAPTVADEVFDAVTLPSLPSSPSPSADNDAQLLTWTAPTLPTSWKADGGQFMLPGLGGTTTIRYRMSTVVLTNPIPEWVSWARSGMSEVVTKLTYDSLDRLTERAVTYGGSPVLTISLEREGGSGRITEVKTGGPWMKLPLDYKLAYPNPIETRPSSITVATPGVDLLTLDIAYGSGTKATLPFGLQALNFDDSIATIDVGVSGGTSKVPVLQLEFAQPAGTPLKKQVLVYDIYQKSPASRVLRGRLQWTIDDDQRKSDMTWTPVIQPSGTDGTTTTFYQGAWGAYAALADDAVSTGTETIADLRLKAADLLSPVESFDVEKLFPLVNVAKEQFADYQKQFERTAGNLIEQVKKASGN